MQQDDATLNRVHVSSPGWVVVESEGRSVGVVVALEVLHDHQVHSLRVPGVAAGVSHAAPPVLQHQQSYRSTLHHVGLQPRLSPHLEVVPHDEGQLPEAGEGLGGAGRDHAVVEYLVVQGVGPAGGLVLGGVTHQHSLLDF